MSAKGLSAGNAGDASCDFDRLAPAEKPEVEDVSLGSSFYIAKCKVLNNSVGLFKSMRLKSKAPRPRQEYQRCVGLQPFMQLCYACFVFQLA